LVAAAAGGCAGAARHDAPSTASPTAASDEPPLVQLTNTPEIAESQPAWSPDGDWIAVSCPHGRGASDLWLISSDGARRRRLTDDAAQDVSPAWSPDGSRIAFGSTRGSRAPAIWILRLADSSFTQLTHEARRVHAPEWSPDGARITYYGIASGDEQVWSIPADGGEATRLTFHVTQSWSAAWSPSGSEIVFSGYRNAETGGSLFVMPPEGEGPACERSRTLTRRTDHGWDRFCTWSPDGQWIAFAGRPRDGALNDWNIWLVSADGEVEVPLTTHPAADTEPSWSPDGTRIVFQSDRSGNVDLWVLDASRWTRAAREPTPR
jgi:TolB protein